MLADQSFSAWTDGHTNYCAACGFRYRGKVTATVINASTADRLTYGYDDLYVVVSYSDGHFDAERETLPSISAGVEYLRDREAEWRNYDRLEVSNAFADVADRLEDAHRNDRYDPAKKERITK